MSADYVNSKGKTADALFQDDKTIIRETNPYSKYTILYRDDDMGGLGGLCEYVSDNGDIIQSERYICSLDYKTNTINQIFVFNKDNKLIGSWWLEYDEDAEL